MTCQECPLHEHANTVCMPPAGGSGDILFVNASPDEQEDNSGTPFTGPCGHLLREAVRALDLDRYGIRYTHVARCRPPGDRRPSIKERKTCTTRHLFPLIESTQPQLVVALGDVALRSLTGRGGVLKNAGRVLPGTDTRPPVLVTASPGYILRNPAYEQQWHSSLKIIHSVLAPKEDRIPTRYALLSSLGEVRRVLRASGGTPVAFDYETTGLDPHADRVTSVSVSTQEGVAFSFDPKIAVREWTRWLKSDCPKVVQNAHFESYWSLVKYGTTPNNIVWDTKFGSKLHDEEAPSGLKAMALRHTDLGTYDDEMTALVEEKGWANCTLDDVWRYNCADSDATLRIYNIQQHDTHVKKHMPRMLQHVDLLSYMRRRGLHIDTQQLFAVGTDLVRMKTEALNQLRDHVVIKQVERKTGKPFNPASPPQCKMLVHEKLGLPILYKSKTTGESSVGKDYFRAMKGKHPTIDLIKTYREVEQLRKNFFVPLVTVRQHDIVHPQWTVGGTVTWRLACGQPNIQNIPKHGDHAPMIRSLFTPRPGRMFVQADYSQAELRVMASLAEEEAMIDAFLEGRDIHTETAMRAYHLPLSGVTDQHRSRAKAVNFGVLYGGTGSTLERRSGIPRAEGDNLIKLFWGAYKRVAAWVKARHDEIKVRGWVESPFGIRRHVNTKGKDEYQLQHALNQAGNFPIQHAAAEMTLGAMHEIEKQLGHRGCLIAQVHDSILVEAQTDYVDEVAILLKEIMEGLYSPEPWLKVPMKADVEVGCNWYDMVSYSPGATDDDEVPTPHRVVAPC